MRPGVLLIPLLFSSCKEDCEPKVSGGTAAESDSIGAAVRVFYDLLEPNLELCVASVRKVDRLRGDAGGRYNSVSRRVRVAAAADDLVFHELCHALQYQNGLSVKGPNWVLSPEQDQTRGPFRSPRREAFAIACEEGPTSAFLLGQACPYDPDGIDALYEVRDLFTGPDRRVILDEEGIFTLAALVPTAGTTFDLAVTANSVRLTLEEGLLFIDPWSAQPVAEEDVLDPVRTSSAFSQGSMLSHVSFEAPNGATAARRVFGRDQQFVPLGCVWPEERVFAFDGWLWSAYLDEGAVRLGYWWVP